MNYHPSSKGDILVVDDTPENLRFLSKILAAQGYDVRAVTSGSAALMGVKAQPPDLILMDVVMPAMNGYDVCRRLKASSMSQDIPIIFISALNETFDKVKAFSEGGVDYITKPFQVEEVLARIENHLGRRQLQIQLLEALEREKALNQRIKELAIWEERTRIAREIHDSLGHGLVALNIQIETALALWSDQPEEAHSFLVEAKQQGTDALQAVRQSVSKMRENLPPEHSLEEDIAQLADDFYRTTQIQPRCEIQLLTPVSISIHTTIYRIIQEGLTNICKYAEATTVLIEIQQTPEQLTLIVQDNGKGFEVHQPTEGFGLIGMRERIAEVGGVLEIESQSGAGCQIICRF